MDALAAAGIYFQNALVAYPVHSASKAAMLTGRCSHVNGLQNNTANFHKPASQLTPAGLVRRMASKGVTSLLRVSVFRHEAFVAVAEKGRLWRFSRFGGHG